MGAYKEEIGLLSLSRACRCCAHRVRLQPMLKIMLQMRLGRQQLQRVSVPALLLYPPRCTCP